MDQPTHRAQATVDLGAIRSNVELLRASAAGADLMAVVKADATATASWPARVRHGPGEPPGSGRPCSKRPSSCAPRGTRARLLAWLLDPADAFGAALAADVDLSASAPWVVDAVVAAARATGRTARVHLKVDSGLGRAGAPEAAWPDLLTAARTAEADGTVEVVGVWSHLAHADAPAHPTVDAQVRAFDEAVSLAEAMGIHPEVRHLANSAATLARPDAHYDLVRPGLAVYGLSPMPADYPAARLGLRPGDDADRTGGARQAGPGGPGVSYLHRYTTDRGDDARAGAARLRRRRPARGHQRRAGARCRSSTDHRGHRLHGPVRRSTSATTRSRGDEVVLFGPGDQGEPTADDWADAPGTISYEVVTRIGPRVPRVHVP